MGVLCGVGGGGGGVLLRSTFGVLLRGSFVGFFWDVVLIRNFIYHGEANLFFCAQHGTYKSYFYQARRRPAGLVYI